MKTNSELQHDVMEELKWEPILNASEIGVITKNGVVTLTGHVDSYSKKYAAEQATKRVAGVKAVVESIEVKLSGSSKRTDSDIAQAALNAIKWHSSVPDERIKLKVENGWVYLEGDVDWDFQREAARTSVENLLGVRGVSSQITVKPHIKPLEIKEKIRKSFERSATIDADNIRIETDGSKVILSGCVHSWTAREDAETAAWAAPGVSQVENKIEMEESLAMV